MICDGCTICCKILEIKAINKKAWERCKHCENGCTIYATRPAVCREFECAYLAGSWRSELRPDRCGVMIYKDKARGYQALMFVEPAKVDPLIMDQISFLETEYGVKITGIDARPFAQLSEVYG